MNRRCWTSHSGSRRKTPWRGWAVEENQDNLRNRQSSSSSSSSSQRVSLCPLHPRNRAMAAQKINEAHEHIAKAEKWWDMKHILIQNTAHAFLIHNTDFRSASCRCRSHCHSFYFITGCREYNSCKHVLMKRDAEWLWCAFIIMSHRETDCVIARAVLEVTLAAVVLMWSLYWWWCGPFLKSSDVHVRPGQVVTGYTSQ